MQKNDINKKILWIEDSTYPLQSLVKPLEERGYRISYATTEKDALDALLYDVFDLILLDIILPTGSDSGDFYEYVGVRLADEIINVRKISTPIIVISVVNNPDVINKLENLGIDNILQKGYILPSRLVKVVEDILYLR